MSLFYHQPHVLSSDGEFLQIARGDSLSRTSASLFAWGGGYRRGGCDGARIRSPILRKRIVFLSWLEAGNCKLIPAFFQVPISGDSGVKTLKEGLGFAFAPYSCRLFITLTYREKTKEDPELYQPRKDRQFKVDASARSEGQDRRQEPSPAAIALLDWRGCHTMS